MSGERTRAPDAGLADRPDAAGAPVGRPEMDDGSGAVVRERGEIRAGLVYCVKVFVAVRVALAVVALVGVALLPNFTAEAPELRGQLGIPGPTGPSGWEPDPISPGWHNLVTAWERQDALWYLRIADSGYRHDDGSAAFFPLYPLTVRAVSFLLGDHPLAAGLLVSNLAFLGALMALFVLGRREVGDRLARRSVLYAAVFPSAFFFLAPFTESMFLLLALVTLWAARTGRWEAAGVAGVLAALTRNIGVVLVAPMAVEAVHQALARRPWRWPVRPLAWSAAPFLGTFVYLWFWRAFSGDWLAPVHQQANWEREPAFFGWTLLKGTTEAFRWIGQYAGGYHLLDWLIAVPVLAAVAYAALKLRPAYGVYALAAVLVPLSYVWPSRPLMSFFRFALVVFPIYWAFARWTDRRPWLHEVFVAISASLLGIMTLLFVNWYYVF
jgi:Gpi18-like mannosyltransferase